jgi:hypothetical protein
MVKNWYSNESQVFWTCKALIQGRTINHMDEIGEVRGWRLGAIIHNLRRKYDWPIDTEYKGPERIAHYTLRNGCDWRCLAFPRSAQKLKSEVGDG